MRNSHISLAALGLLSALLAACSSGSDREWQVVGDAGFSTGSAMYQTLAIDTNGIPVVGFTNTESAQLTNAATVMSYNNNAWAILGATGNDIAASHPTAFTSLAIDSANNTFLAYQDLGDPNNKKTIGLSMLGATESVWKSIPFPVEESNGNIATNQNVKTETNGVLVAYQLQFLTGITTGYVVHASFCTESNTIYSCSMIQEVSQITNAPALPSLAIATDGTEYVSSIDENGHIIVNVAKNKGPWSTLEGTITATAAGYPSLAVTQDESGTNLPTVAYSDTESGNATVNVKQYKAVDDAPATWIALGTPIAAPTGVKVNNVQLALAADGTPYVAYQLNDTNHSIMVCKFINGAWQSLGDSAGIATGSKDFAANSGLSLAIDQNDRVYISYQDNLFAGKTTVQRF